MDSLEKYIKDNAAAFNDADLPEGHLERFEKKLDAQESEKVFGSSGSRRTLTWIPKVLLAAAAALAAVLILNRPKEDTRDWFAGIGNDQIEICDTYYERMAELYETILMNNPDGSVDNQIAGIAEESIPLIDLLPEEMDPEAKAAILKEYYGTLLDGLEKISKIK